MTLPKRLSSGRAATLATEVSPQGRGPAFYSDSDRPECLIAEKMRKNPGLTRPERATS